MYMLGGGNPSINAEISKDNGSTWRSILSIDSGGQWGTPVRFNTFNSPPKELLTDGVVLGDDAGASATLDNFAPYQRFYSHGWKTAGTPGTQCMAAGIVGCAPEQGVTNPIGTTRFIYGTNRSTPIIENELMRLEWGDRLRVATKVPLHINTPTSAPTLVENSSMAFYLDEATNSLKATIKLSNGTVKTATLVFD
jgi:hypothetical protein